MVGSTQPQDKLRNWRSQDDKMLAPMWWKESNERKGQKSNNPRGRESCQMGNR